MSFDPEPRKLRLAAQKDGRLTQQTMELLRTAGLEFDLYRAQLFAACRNFDLELLFIRDDDIPEYVAQGVVDLGIVGQNVIAEAGFDVCELQPLGFGYCQLVVAVAKESDIAETYELAGAKVATSYSRSAGAYFESLGVDVCLIPVSGSVELAPALGVAQAVVELTASGSMLRMHDLRPIDTVLSSETTLVGNPESCRDPIRRQIIDRFLVRLRAVLAAKAHKYVMMNVPRAAVERVEEIAGGMKSPTVVPLADPDWVAVHTAVREADFWDVIEALRAAGATQILVSPIEKRVL